MYAALSLQIRHNKYYFLLYVKKFNKNMYFWKSFYTYLENWIQLLKNRRCIYASGMKINHKK